MENRDVKLVKVDTENFEDLIDLRPDEEGKKYVASNIYSLAEAYANIADGKMVQPFGIYDGETPVGFVMIGYDIGDEEDQEEYPLVKNNYLLWRYMVDEKYLCKGYGKEAMKLVLDYIRSFPLGEAEYCIVTYEPENIRAKNLYQSYGFVEEEKMPEDWDEIPAVLKL